ncbi:hypothetical protein U1Q18_029639, partial [Sarracenia purpurea var. burkii]
FGSEIGSVRKYVRFETRFSLELDSVQNQLRFEQKKRVKKKVRFRRERRENGWGKIAGSDGRKNKGSSDEVRDEREPEIVYDFEQLSMGGAARQCLNKGGAATFGGSVYTVSGR